MNKVLLAIFLTVFLTGFFLLTGRPVYAADVTPPVTNYTMTPSEPDGNNDWFTSIITFELEAIDLQSGVKEIWYKISNNPWQIVEFNDTVNRAPNPSFEVADSTTTGLQYWEATVQDASTIYSQDQNEYHPDFPLASARIHTTGTGWHGINHSDNFAVSSSYNNMSASVSLKTQAVVSNAYFKVYAISQDPINGQTVTQIAQSSSLTNTNDWTRLNLNFTVNVPNAIGVYLDIGLDGPGTVWMDAVSLSTSPTATNTAFTVGADNANHQVIFYSVDQAGNAETYSCEEPLKNCVQFKLDQTPPGNWHNSGAFRGIPPGPSDHHVYAHSNVEDFTSGLSTLSNRFQYLPNTQTIFGIYSDLMVCGGSSSWLSNQWADLEPLNFNDGDKLGYLLTPKVDYCDSVWRICKYVRFYAEDMAGNWSMKDLCLNGPWIKLRGNGIVRANHNVSMVSESSEPNTDGLIEIGGTSIDFFTSAKNWRVRNSPTPVNYSYNNYFQLTGDKNAFLPTANLQAASGIFLVNGDYEITRQKTPSAYRTATFNQIIFVDGDLIITDDVSIANASTALFVVSGDVLIDKKTELVGVAIITDGSFYNAYNIRERETTKTLVLRGFYSANKFFMQRTLQGVNNNDAPSDDFTYEPKYTIQLRQFFGKNSVVWKSVD
jgi:hypothetical protein